MNRIKTILISGLIASFLISGAAFADTITVRADAWPPYNDEPNSSQPGYMIELAELIFTPLGHNIDYKLMPWSRSLLEVRKGTYDAVVGTDTDESPDFVFPQESFGVNQNGFYVKKGSNWKYTGIDSVKQVRLGIIDGYGYYEVMDNYIENYKGKNIFNATGDDALPKLLKMLKAGRIDVVIENINVMGQTLRESGLDNNIVQGGLSEDKGYLAMAFSPAKASSKKYARIFDEGIVKLRQSGKLQEVLAKYGLKDWK